MSFFKEFKADLSQAVNELVSEDDTKKELISNDDYNEMVNTLDVEEENISNNNEVELDYLSLAAENNHENEITEPEVNMPVVNEPEVKDIFKTNLNDKSFSEETAEVTKGTVILGDITSEGSINLFGKVKGNVTCLGKLVVSGEIIGASKAAEIYTNNSKISGDVTSDGSIKIGNGSVIIGNVYASSAVIGGAVKGDIDVKGPVILDSSAIVQGNIKSRAVQINTGAVVEGLVSQCYAEVDYNSLFDDTFSK